MSYTQDDKSPAHAHQSSQPHAEDRCEEGHTSQVSNAACMATQEPHSVPDFREVNPTGVTSRLLFTATQLEEQMTQVHPETHARSLASPSSADSIFVGPDEEHQAPTSACCMDPGAPHSSDAPPLILSHTPCVQSKRGEDYLQSQSSVGDFRLSLASELHTPKSSHPHTSRVINSTRGVVTTPSPEYRFHLCGTE